MTVRELRQPRCKSKKVVIEILQDMLATARREKVTGIAVIMTINNKHHDTDWAVPEGGNIPMLVGCMDRTKDNLVTAWKEHTS